MEYFLTSTDLHSNEIYLNGKLLKLTQDDKLPPLQGAIYNDGSTIQIAPLTYGFIHFPKSDNKLCMN